MLVRYEHDGSMVSVLKEREENILRKDMLEDNLVSLLYMARGCIL